MKLVEVQAREFRSISDTTPFEVGEITCLVGKNEAGKTSVLRALYQLNPIVPGHAGYSITDDYPRMVVEDYRIAVESGKRKNAVVARAVFELDKEDLSAVHRWTGKQALSGNRIEVTRAYEEEAVITFPINEAMAIRDLAGRYELPAEVAASVAQSTDVKSALAALAAGEQTEAVQKLTQVIAPAAASNSFGSYVIDQVLRPRVPKFLYFDEYYQMRGCESIAALKKRKAEGKLAPSDYPLLGLINRARLDLDQLVSAQRTRELKNKLQGASNYLTKQIITYWSQNKHLRLLFDVREARPGDPEGMRSGLNIWGEVEDTKHFVTTEMGSRSRGFIWFFSFLAWYGDVREEEANVILLLDEPGLSLHGKAQEDLLRYFETEVKGHNQLIYTTHSPFMVDSTKFDRVRIVQDLSIEEGPEPPADKVGTRVLTDVLEATSDSLFPLQGALGYEIYQSLFVGPNSLVVEGVSDLLFLQAITVRLEESGRQGLSKGWTITPVGGSDKVPTFVALLGGQRNLNVAVLIDYQKRDRQSIENLYKKKLLQKKNVRTYAEFTGTAEADVEDMFDDVFYIELVNGAFKGELLRPIVNSDLNANLPRMTLRLEDYFKANPMKACTSFNHFRPAKYFLDNLASLSPSKGTMDRFEAACAAINMLLRN